MFAGDDIQDFQYQFRGLSIGHNTPFSVKNVTGLLGHAEARSRDIARGNRHGSIPVALLFSPRIIAFDLEVSDQFDGTPIEDLLDELSDAFQPPDLRSSTSLDEFVYKRPDRTPRRFLVRCSKFDFDSDYNVGRGLASGSIELVANDPVSYDNELKTESLVLSVGETSDQVSVENNGNFRNGTPPILYITGTCIDPIVECMQDAERQLKLEVNLAANQICRVNMETFEVAVQTGVGAWVESYDIVRDDSQFFHLMPGDNTIVFSRTGSGSSATLRLDWRDAWARG
jgi:hypothetical protein